MLFTKIFLLVVLANIEGNVINPIVYDESVNTQFTNEVLPFVYDEPLPPNDNEIMEDNLEYGNHFEGDMKLTTDQREKLVSNDTLSTRTGMLDLSYRWPKDEDGYVIVPYKLSKSSKYTHYQKALICNSMKNLERHTCVRFVVRTDESDFVFIKSGDGCSSHVGKTGDKQELSLQKNGCFSRGTILHELLHALGFDHMQSHIDRDKYIKIQWKNIEDREKSNFEKVNAEEFGNFRTSYDLHSVMHYSPNAFSKNGKVTIVPVNNYYKNIIGQRNGLSRGDKTRVNRMYECYD